MMRELLWKDWRVYRAAVVGGAVLAACPYAVLLTMQAAYPPGGGNTFRTYGRVLEQAALAGMLLTLLTAAVFGGIAFAAERRDRSAEFLAMLPVRRWPVVLSKLLLAVACLTMAAAAHRCIGMIATRWRIQANLPPGYLLGIGFGVALLASVAILFFGVAWMLSVYLHSAAVAATVAIGVAAVLLMATSGAVDVARHDLRRAYGPEVDFGYLGITVMSLLVGTLAFVISTPHYLRRVTP